MTLIHVELKITKDAKMGGLTVQMSSNEHFYFTSDTEAMNFALPLEDDPSIEIVRYRALTTGSARAATADLAMAIERLEKGL